MAGATAAVDFLAGLAGPGYASRVEKLDAFFSELQLREGALLTRLWKGLESIPGIKLYGPRPSENRAPTVSFTVKGRVARDVSSSLANEFGAFLSHGDFYASTVVHRLGLTEEGMVRAGVSLYTTEEEVDRVIEGLASMADGVSQAFGY
jgi:selenocysteine lyase/cysteine desulfurase